MRLTVYQSIDQTLDLCYIGCLSKRLMYGAISSRGVGIPKEYRINERIRIPEVRVVDERGEQLGVMPTRQALILSQERGLDLVEVAPAGKPPVCRLMDYGKFRYEATRREREARKTQRANANNEVREVRMQTRIGDHDLESKTRLVRRLLGEGSKVRVSVRFRGREITHPEVGAALLKRVTENLVEDATMEKAPSFEGRFLAMILAPIKGSSKTQKEEGQKEKAGAEA